MKLNQLADQLHAKTIHLIGIAKALRFDDLPNPHGGTPLSPAQAQKITNVCRYMQSHQIAEPNAAIAQMNHQTQAADETTVYLRAAVVDELRRRYPDGPMSDRILRLLGAVQSFEQLSARCVHRQAIIVPAQPTTQP